MKTSEITQGKAYTDGKGNVRLVVATGSDHTLHSGQLDCDTVRYRLVAKKRGPNVVGSEYNSTRKAFASWAKYACPVPA